MAYNKELFYESQLNNDALTWGLLKKGTTSGDILTGILDENDYSFGVSHSYSGAHDELGIASKIAEAGNKASDWMRYTDKSLEQLPVLFDANHLNLPGVADAIKSGQDTIKNAGDWLGKQLFGADATEKLKDFARRAERGRFFNPLDNIQTFQGTKIDFRFPELKTILLSGVGASGDGEVKKKVKNLNELFIGSIEQFTGMYGLQNAPNQYLPDFSELNENTEFDGTFILRLGDKKLIKNLILTDYQVNLSKFKRHDPAGKITDDYLYAEVTINLMPAAFLSREMINAYFELSS